MGTGFYVAFALLGAPLNERLLAATRTQGTIAFLVFLSDCCGYAVSVALLLYNDFGVPETSNTTATDDAATATGDANAAELHTFLKVVWSCGLTALVLMLVALAYFGRVLRAPPASAYPPTDPPTSTEDEKRIAAEIAHTAAATPHAECVATVNDMSQDTTESRPRL